MPMPLADLWVLSGLRRSHPLLYTAHDTRMSNASASADRTVALLRRLDPDLIIVHTRQGISRLVDGGVEESKLFLVSHPPLSLPRNLKDEERYLAGVGKTFELAMIGEVKAYKGFEAAFRALATLPEHVARHVRLRVAGRPFFDVERLRDEMLPQGRRAMVQFDLRYLSEEEFAQTLDDSDCILLPYLEIEASGVFYTALSRAKMIIASDVGAFGEVLPQDFLIPVGDHAALAAKIARLVEEPSSHSYLADRLRQIARDQVVNSAFETRLGEAFRRVKELYRERMRGESG
jgi:glycosyltransferase involved in cell wall biosynthesis